MENEEARTNKFVLYRTKAESILHITKLKTVSPEDLRLIRIMHSPDLISMKGLVRFTNLIEVNLSSNSIEKMTGLFTLKKLKILNLSCNKIKVIDGLRDLKCLEVLILSHNRIIELRNLDQLHGEDYTVNHIDLSDNHIATLSELTYLSGLSALKKLTLQNGDDTNPICKDREGYFRGLLTLDNVNVIQRVDEHSVGYIQ